MRRFTPSKVCLADMPGGSPSARTKPVTGHLLAASGAIETIICALAIKNRCIPFTLNLNDPDDGIDCNLVSGQSRPYPLRAVMNVNCGFGGKNACLILKEYS